MSASPVTVTREKSSRLFFVDHWRAAIIILVVLHHISVIYGANTSFYYLEPHDTLATIVLVIFQLLNQAWFMGAFFLLSGYFTPRSFDHKGTGNFIRDRLLRLGIPLAFYSLVFSPLVSIYGVNAMPTSLTHLTAPLTWADYPHLVGIGVFWFAAMLIIFDFGYALWRLATRNRAMERYNGPAVPSFITIAVFVVGLAVTSYFIRIPLPLGKSLFSFPSLAYFPQYLSFFILGTMAARGDWFRTISGKMGKWGFVAVVLATITLFPIALTGLGKLSGDFLGGAHWQSAVYALWDSVLSVGLCLALVTFFRRFFDRQSKPGTFLSQQSFAVYFIHIPILVFLAIWLRGVHTENLLKFALLAVIAVPLCFTIAYIIRRIPGVSRIL